LDYIRSGARFRLKPQLKNKVDKEKRHQVVYLDKVVPFLHKAAIRSSLEEIPQDFKVTVDATDTVQMDTDVRTIIEEIVENESSQKRGWEFQR
jgi:hypothetical protein